MEGCGLPWLILRVSVCVVLKGKARRSEVDAFSAHCTARSSPLRLQGDPSSEPDVSRSSSTRLRPRRPLPTASFSCEGLDIQLRKLAIHIHISSTVTTITSLLSSNVHVSINPSLPPLKHPRIPIAYTKFLPRLYRAQGPVGYSLLRGVEGVGCILG